MSSLDLILLLLLAAGFLSILLELVHFLPPLKPFSSRKPSSHPAAKPKR